jgi:predicted DNA binding CopG/RHH family protein
MAKSKLKQVVIPKFSSEADEAAWWDTHRSEIEVEIRQRMKRKSPLTLGTLLQGTKPSQPITLRIPKEDLETARRLAAQEGLGYQTYIKMLLRGALAKNASKDVSNRVNHSRRTREYAGGKKAQSLRARRESH